jgi:hypothetical protein
MMLTQEEKLLKLNQIEASIRQQLHLEHTD